MEISVLSTKKLTNPQRNFLLNAGFSVVHADFITISLQPFELIAEPQLLVFTSQNAVKSVVLNAKYPFLKNIPCICVGSKTQQLLVNSGFQVLAQANYASELTGLIPKLHHASSVAFFTGDQHSLVLPTFFKENQINYTQYTVYHNTAQPLKITTRVNALLFFSPSAVKSYMQNNHLTDEVCFCIGTTTTEALLHIKPKIVVARHQTVENVIIQCIKYYRQEHKKKRI